MHPFFYTTNNLVHKKIPEKRVSQAHVRRARELASVDTATSGHVSLPLAYRHITNSAKEVKQRADRASTPRGKSPGKWCQKSRKMQEKNGGGDVARCVFLFFMHLHAISSTLMHSSSDFVRNRKNHVKVTGLSCISFGTSYTYCVDGQLSSIKQITHWRSTGYLK